ncbi:zinc finger E-box-binding homeobox 1-like isoform X4 [Acipenser ruthenus]|uniref:zinc finger E-box-binding homeobox 1-like isoform X4 n=1 Tax=Acipenser ruthenus TaxID=7906 RepID=UPI00145B77EB|nr:zinc finger E-box-binding homeobox 1-like isoform X4 [Acipenser ruthenus]
MADGPRCKRRKQANPRRNNVTSYNNVVEANSDSDDEDKLHIVEEESVTDAADCEKNVPDDDLPSSHAVLPENGQGEEEEEEEEAWEEETKGEDTLGPEAQPGDVGFKDDACGSEAEDEQNNDPIVEEMLQQADTAVIYPEAPEEEQRQGTPEASGHDENGTADAFSQLLTCPYCDRGYKRYTSLKEHIKYRHEKNEDNFSCSLCSYTFAYRTQLERHMTAHKSGRDQRHVAQSGGNRKFKCTECGKAFKYKHHLKEHLRIHSGEKPYECPNCKKRFSHSGSYSSHISSKKCIGVMPVNGRPRPAGKTSQCPSPSLSSSPSTPARTQLREKGDNSKPLQEQLPVNQIKIEPVDYEYKPIVVTSGIGCATPLQNGAFNGGTPLQTTASPQGVVQAVVLPAVGLVSPISINLSDIQNVLKVAVDGNIIRQVLESAHANAAKEQGGVQPGGHSLISAFSLPLVDQDGTTKIIINYSLEQQPSQVQILPQSLKKENPSPIEICKTEKLPEDLTVKPGKSKIPKSENSSSTCLLCDDCPGGLDALQEIKHCNLKSEGGILTSQVNGENAEKTDSTVSSPTAEGSLSLGQPPLKNLLSLLKAYYALNAQPTTEELSKISDSVSLPLDVVKKWFEKMQTGQIPVGAASPSEHEAISSESDETQNSLDPAGDIPDSTTTTERPLQLTKTQVILITPSSVKTNSSRTNTPSPSPLNLSSTGPVLVKTEEDTEEGTQAEPLDLSLPKQPREEMEQATSSSVYQNSVYSVQEEPLNLTCTKKDQPQSDSINTSPNPVYVCPPSANPINIAIPTVTTQLPTIVAISDQSSVPCLRALGTNQQTILIPQVTYTYSTLDTSPAVPEAQQKTVQVNGSQEERQETSSEGVSTVEDQNDSDSTPPRKKMRKTEHGMYACDLCDKIFQKSSSLLRHKYEHTGKRPHECGICNKAFKHKHHLIEHMRLHSGEKPYQCDKCGKRFSHSGSYSQHMNHRYSYCKREAEEREGPELNEEEEEGEGPGATGEILPREQMSDSRAASPPSLLDSDDRESSTRGEEEEEEEETEEEEEETETKEETAEETETKEEGEDMQVGEKEHEDSEEHQQEKGEKMETEEGAGEKEMGTDEKPSEIPGVNREDSEEHQQEKGEKMETEEGAGEKEMDTDEKPSEIPGVNREDSEEEKTPEKNDGDKDKI